MKIYLSSATFHNRAPFEKLELNFEANEIALLTAVNGRGKTTVLSHIVDAFHEMARPFFQGEYEDKENKFYRVSSHIENLDAFKPSLVYLRFKTESEELIDYINVRGPLSEAAYNLYELPNNRINFNELKESLDTLGFAKKISSNFDQKKALAIFTYNILTYFPSYRYEAPGYLNDPYQIKLNFTKTSGFQGHLRNPIEVVSGLPQLANWIMDVVLDMMNRTPTNDDSHTKLFQHLNTILTNSLSSKCMEPLRFGIGNRNFGGIRIQVVNVITGLSLYPSIFNISAGESSMLCLFGELIRQADKNANNIELNAISGIVLVDEVDKHLHIKLQKEILPALFKLFPNIQFILSSHSPFLSMGLAEVAAERTKIIDLENFGISKDPSTNELYAEVYRMMIGENDRFKDLYRSLEEKVKNVGTPLIITEGKTDVQHLRSAKIRLGIQGCDVEFFDNTENWGSTKLKALLGHLSKVPQARKIIGIFDRDEPNIVGEIESDGRTYKTYGNNVFAFCLPIPPGREKYTNISIEFFYNEIDLQKGKNGRRLYFNNEVEIRQSASGKKERTLVRLDVVKSQDENEKKIYDEDIGSLDWLHSKAVFADLVENDPAFQLEIDFRNFQLIFDKLDEIVSL